MKDRIADAWSGEPEARRGIEVSLSGGIPGREARPVAEAQAA